MLKVITTLGVLFFGGAIIYNMEQPGSQAPAILGNLSANAVNIGSLAFGHSVTPNG